jgi:hypothetical protein
MPILALNDKHRMVQETNKQNATNKNVQGPVAPNEG